MEQIAIIQKQTDIDTCPTPSYLKAEALKKSCARMLHGEASKNGGARFKFSRIILCISARSNVGSNYCDEKALKDAPGTVKVSSAKEALRCLREAAKADPRLRVVSVVGLGDPLGSDTTFEVLEAIQKEFPHFTRSISTDGLLLPKKLRRLEELGVSAVSVNVNAVDAEVGAQIYSSVSLNGKTLQGKEAFEVLSINQLEGVRNAADAGFMVEVNAAYIPGVNSEHLVEVARIVKSLGAYVINIAPLASERYSGLDLPSPEEMAALRKSCEDVCTSEIQLYTPSALNPAMD